MLLRVLKSIENNVWSGPWRCRKGAGGSVNLRTATMAEMPWTGRGISLRTGSPSLKSSDEIEFQNELESAS
jgi:hypothetical protein